MEKQRARTAEEKTHKKALILKAAEDLFRESHSSELPAVASIALKSRLAKGTIYLYFQTKEEIFLEVLKAKYQFWFTRMIQEIQEISDVQNPKAYVAAILSPIKNDTVFLNLTSMAQSVLQVNVKKEMVYSHKDQFGQQVEFLASAIMSKIPISREELIQLMVASYSHIIGSWKASVTPFSLLDIKSRVEHQFLFPTFLETIEQSLSDLWQGAFHRILNKQKRGLLS